MHSTTDHKGSKIFKKQRIPVCLQCCNYSTASYSYLHDIAMAIKVCRDPASYIASWLAIILTLEASPSRVFHSYVSVFIYTFKLHYMQSGYI